MEATYHLSVELVATCLALCLTYLVLVYWKRNRKLPPGPWGIPVLGYYPFLLVQAHVHFDRLAKRYGDVFSFRSAGGKLFVVLNGYRMIKDILVNRSEEFIGRPLENNLLEWLSDGLGVTQEEGPSWKEHRRYFLQTVKNFGFGKLEIEGSIHDEIKLLKRDLLNADSRPTDFNIHVAYAVNSVIAKVMVGRKFEKDGDVFPRLRQSVHDLIDVFADRRFMLVGYPFLFSKKFFKWGADINTARLFLKNTVKKIIEEHVRTFDPNNLRDYVDSYLHEREKLKENGKLEQSTFTMERLLSITMNMIMEGTDSVGDSITALLTEASKHPEEQKKVQEELDAVVGRERLPSWADRTRLPYLEAFIQELFRIAQSFYITTHYCNFEETTIQGYRIPKRSIVIGNLWSINNDPEFFPDPLKFDVGRYLAKDGTKVKTEGPFPFSMGKRDCVGKSLAQMEVFLLIASVLQTFTLEPTGEKGILRVIPRP